MSVRNDDKVGSLSIMETALEVVKDEESGLGLEYFVYFNDLLFALLADPSDTIDPKIFSKCRIP